MKCYSASISRSRIWLLVKCYPAIISWSRIWLLVKCYQAIISWSRIWLSVKCYPAIISRSRIWLSVKCYPAIISRSRIWLLVKCYPAIISRSRIWPLKLFTSSSATPPPNIFLSLLIVHKTFFPLISLQFSLCLPFSFNHSLHLFFSLPSFLIFSTIVVVPQAARR